MVWIEKTCTFKPSWIQIKITQLNCAKYTPSVRYPDRSKRGRQVLQKSTELDDIIIHLMFNANENV
ncbi:hypothetical protein ACTXT7_007724 [Hymenolepis weldensis]